MAPTSLAAVCRTGPCLWSLGQGEELISCCWGCGLDSLHELLVRLHWSLAMHAVHTNCQWLPAMCLACQQAGQALVLLPHAVTDAVAHVGAEITSRAGSLPWCCRDCSCCRSMSKTRLLLDAVQRTGRQGVTFAALDLCENSLRQALEALQGESLESLKLVSKGLKVVLWRCSSASWAVAIVDTCSPAQLNVCSACMQAGQHGTW